MKIWIQWEELYHLKIPQLTASSFKIKHVVVLMEENRSFDHIFGWGKRAKPPLTVDGLTGKETNPLNTSDPNTPDIAVSDHAPFINACDPNHGTLATAKKSLVRRPRLTVILRLPQCKGSLTTSTGHTMPIPILMISATSSTCLHPTVFL